MDLQIKGKKALVTGSTLGIGYAIAELLAGEGGSVVVNGRSEGNVSKAVTRIKEVHPHAEVSGVVADLGNAEGAKKITETVPHVDILINSLGIFEPKAFEDIPDEDWFRLFEINVMSGVRMTRHYLPSMKKQQWGRVIFVASESAVNIAQEMVHYGMTKTAQL